MNGMLWNERSAPVGTRQEMERSGRALQKGWSAPNKGRYRKIERFGTSRALQMESTPERVERSTVSGALQMWWNALVERSMEGIALYTRRSIAWGAL